MAPPRVPKDVLQETAEMVALHGSNNAAAHAMGLTESTVRRRMDNYRRQTAAKPFLADPVPSELLSASELLERRKADFARKKAAETAKKLINVKVNIDGPIGIVHLGDPHVDDDGCDIGALERHVNIINRTQGLFGANLGDLQNNWIGRLAHLYGQQSTSAAESWTLTEWLVTSVQWLYLVGGNHDCWSGAGDPLKWMTRDQAGVFDAWGVRLNLVFPNDKQVRVNARHDFAGHSMWNPAHGPMKAIQGGWRDHILTCGHKHTSFTAGPLKDPSTGMLSWAIRCAGYKVFDRYAKQEGLPDQNAFPAAVTLINPEYDDSDPRLITVIADVEEGAEILTWKRKRWNSGKRAA